MVPSLFIWVILVLSALWAQARFAFLGRVGAAPPGLSLLVRLALEGLLPALVHSRDKCPSAG